MNKTVCCSLAVAALLASPASRAVADTNIGVLDIAKVFENYAMTRDLETRFEEARRAAADEAQQRRDRIDQMRRALAAFDPDSEDFMRREDDVTREEVEFQVWSKQTENRLKGNHKRWLLRIYDDVREVVGAIAEERKLDLVLTYDQMTKDAPDSVALRQQILLQKVIYHNSKTDLTKEVLKRLNEKYRDSGGLTSLDAPPVKKKAGVSSPRPADKP